MLKLIKTFKFHFNLCNITECFATLHLAARYQMHLLNFNRKIYQVVLAFCICYLDFGTFEQIKCKIRLYLPLGMP